MRSIALLYAYVVLVLAVFPAAAAATVRPGWLSAQEGTHASAGASVTAS